MVSHEQALAEERTKKLTTATPTLKAPSTTAKKPQENGTAEGALAAVAQSQKYAQQLASIPELKAYGTVLKSSSLVELTESETEYVVTAVKHIFKDHIVLQYDIKNTFPETVLEDVSVVATPSDEDEGLEEEFIMPIPKLSTDEPGTVYVSFKKTGDSPFVATSFTNVLKFTSKEIDPTTGEPDTEGYEDEYPAEDLELTGSDYVLPAYAGSFDHVWEQTGANGDEASETLQLGNTKGIAGKFLDPSRQKPSPAVADGFSRRGRAARQDAFPAAAGRDGRRAVEQHAHAEAVRQVGVLGQGGGFGETGLLGEIGRHREGVGAGRGGRSVGFDSGKRGVIRVVLVVVYSLCERLDKQAVLILSAYGVCEPVNDDCHVMQCLPVMAKRIYELGYTSSLFDVSASFLKVS